MATDPTTFYLLKDLSRASGHSVHTLKFYLKSGLLQESGRSPVTRVRYFTQSQLKRLQEIRLWRKQGKSLAEISLLLPDAAPNDPTAALRTTPAPRAHPLAVVG